MRSMLTTLALTFALPTPASAHELWVERDAAGPARIYLGEPDAPLPPGGDPEFAKLTAPRVLAHPDVALSRRTGFLEAQLPRGDVRVWDDAVFAPWGDPGKREGVVYYARAGRSEPIAKLPFEIAPAAANGARFILTRDGKPLPAGTVSLIAPDRSKRDLRTDAAGGIDLGSLRSGRHLLVATRKEDGDTTLPGGRVQHVHRTTTTSFVVL